MDVFYPNQRYTSKGEPELGIGILTETSNRQVKIYFPLSNEYRVYAIESAPLRRVIFKPGDTIVDLDKQSMLIERVEMENGLYIYYGKDNKISEAELGDVTANYGVDDRLFMGDVDSPRSFALRRETLEHEYNRRISPVYGFVGGRIDLIPHQLYIAHEVSSRYAPRVLLSDQVGLGKTIEACLIIHRLLLSGRISRVLILVPESLVHQWFVEVLRKFNMWFNIFDEPRCEALDDGAPEGNSFLANQLIICSTEFLATSEKRTRQALTASWDMLVVDEAHHLEWSLDKVSPEYAVVELLSKVAKGLLLLTATPEQLGIESHFARLRLLDPNRYDNYEDFINESKDHKNIATIVEKLDLNKALNSKETKVLESLFSKERIQSVLKGDELAKDNLIEDLLDQHGPGRVLFRNTRSAMSDFPKRKAHLIPLEVKEDQSIWVERLTKEFVRDINTENLIEEQDFWFKDDPRVLWVLNVLKEISPDKTLLICKSKEKVLALEEALTKRANLNVAVFHEDLTIVQRDKNAAWFTETDGAQILLCSEIGSEGRNFQFANHLILFDLPLHPELLEQRIGRLDRIGQTKDINIYIPYLLESPQHKLVRWFHEGLNAFEKNIEGGYEVFKLFGARLLKICNSPAIKEADSELEALIADTAVFQNKLQEKLSKGRDKLLEMNSFRPKVSYEIIKQIKQEDRDKTLETYLTKVFRYFKMEMEDLAYRTYFIHPASVTTEAFSSIPREGIGVTFDRNHALSREDLSFLSWDHPITTECIDMVVTSGIGSASFGILRNSNSPGLLLELLYVLETSSKQGVFVDRFLPNTPIRIVVDINGNEVTDNYLADFIDKNLTAGQIEPLLDNEALVETILPKMMMAATKIAETQSLKKKEKGLQKMNITLNHEIERLRALKENNNNIRPEEIQTALDEQEELSVLIKNARVRMDAVQLIIKE
ncbi:RNA polymerase-associated protein RapA [Aequorivita sp. KMM 9714]|uniref:RNA polymerase-associated protein RapA n=1 Tax=Aequorivita sp. KMM 9714 TaxID=2707173 RepID=UPI0013EB9A98|nr:RNA polymerase-associated protein RapA [Aequorivita sp. KMM 9714]NGX83926.1 RNA polymerase-associated protein RapA [Aequorivita sp. KMM 9714]